MVVQHHIERSLYVAVQSWRYGDIAQVGSSVFHGHEISRSIFIPFRIVDGYRVIIRINSELVDSNFV